MIRSDPINKFQFFITFALVRIDLKIITKNNSWKKSSIRYNPAEQFCTQQIRFGESVVMQLILKPSTKFLKLRSARKISR